MIILIINNFFLFKTFMLIDTTIGEQGHKLTKHICFHKSYNFSHFFSLSTDFFSKSTFMNTINTIAEPDLGPNCLQR